MKRGETLGGAMRPIASLPVLQIGLRPFYLGGAAFGLIAVALWIAAQHGLDVAGRSSAMSGILWHAHEMVFGFAGAIVVGFLLTAVRAWTSRETLRGLPLAWLWLLWAAARVLVFTGPQPLAAIVDSAFMPVTAIVLLRVLLAVKNRHNVFVPIALGLLAVLDVLFHLWASSGDADLALRAAFGAIGVIVFFVAIITGRIVPQFTQNAIPGFKITRWRWVDAWAAPAVIITLAADAFGVSGTALAVCAALTAVIHAIRIAGWHSWRIGNRPILWILHVACLWIPVGFAMLALAAFDIVAHSLAIHALTVGAMGGAIVAMTTRTALGHTGRALVAGRYEITCYWLMIAAALLRAFGPLVPGVPYTAWIDAAGFCWCAAFAVYLVRYTRFLTSPRADGKPG